MKKLTFITSKKMPNGVLKPLVLAIALAVGSSVNGDTYFVDNTDNANTGSLRQAVGFANINPGADTIEFSATFKALPDPTINLTGEIAVLDSLDTGELTITGPADGDASGVIISGNSNSRIFNSSISLTLENLTLRDGVTGGSDRNGGAIKMYSNSLSSPSDIDLTLNNTLITNNRAENGSGGAIFSYVDGAIFVNSTTISSNSTSGNFASGGGIFSNGSITLNNSTITNNHTEGNSSQGGGISFSSEILNGIITLNNSTVSDNHTRGSSSRGGGIAGRKIVIKDSTVSNNFTQKTKSRGGGILGSNITVTNSTISGNHTIGAGHTTLTTNSPGGGIYSYGHIIVSHSTISGNYTAGSRSSGGGIYAKSIELTQSTVSGNRTDSGTAPAGAAIFLKGGSGPDNPTNTIIQSTITNNTSASGTAGLFISSHIDTTIKNSIISGNTDLYRLGKYNPSLHTENYSFENFHFSNLASAPDATLNVYHSLFGDPESEITNTGGMNINNVFSAVNTPINTPARLKLGPLKNNGGSTQTHEPLINSPAINNGNNAYSPALTDQRGFPRTVDTTVDIGSVERGVTLEPIVCEIMN